MKADMIKHDSDYFVKLDKKLVEVFGIPERHCDDPTGFLVRGILSQNTNDTNRDRAYERLKEKFSKWDDVLAADETDIADAIRVAGLAEIRAKRIKGLLMWLKERNKGRIDASFLLEMPYDKALSLLMGVDGIGLKTAAVFLLFCGGAPIFPVDTHIKRIMVRLGVFPPKTSADKMIKVLSKVIPGDLHYRFHINLLKLGRNICTARLANCEECPISEFCEKVNI